MVFIPRSPPSLSTLDDARKWVEDELRNVALSVNQTQLLNLQPVASEPDRPREGMIVYADGTNFNPGSGTGPYFYDGTTWEPFGSFGAPSPFTTGQVKMTFQTVADPGWILWTDGTIGDATSGSNVRANADTLALFTLFYGSYSDANCPLLTSGGAATTRVAQGTAAAAFAAHCRMNLPKGSGRALGLAGSGAGLTSRTLGSTFGAETVVMTISQMPSHAHSASSNPHGHGTTLAAGISALVGLPVFATNNWEPSGSAHLATAGITITAAGDIGINVAANGGGQSMNVMNPMTYINIMIKL